MPGLRRLASMMTLLAFVLSSGATCAGWKPTPEARRSCCNGGGGCHRAAKASPERTVTQAEADGCCADSESSTSDSAPSSSPFAAAAGFALAVLSSSTAMATLAAMPPAFVSARGRETVPRPPSLVPKHLLLSVFLV